MGMGQLCFYQHTHVKVVLPLSLLPLNPRGRKQFDYHGGIVNPQPAVLAMAAYMARPGSRDQETYLGAYECIDLRYILWLISNL